MSTSTREQMRRELKELAKLAETMGKTPPPPPASEVVAELAESDHEPEPTSSLGTVPPISFPSTPPPFASPLASDSDDLGSKPRKRLGLMFAVAGVGLVVALAGGAMVGKSLAVHSPATGNQPDERAAAAAVAAPPEVTPIETTPPAQPAPKEETITNPVTPSAVAKNTPPPVSTPQPAHKHGAKAAGAPAATKPVVAVAAPAAAPAAVSHEAAAQAAPAPAAKPAPAKASGGSDSLEDLIRKEVSEKK